MRHNRYEKGLASPLNQVDIRTRNPEPYKTIDVYQI